MQIGEVGLSSRPNEMGPKSCSKKPLMELLPSGTLSRGSVPGLHCWSLGSRQLSFSGTLQPLCSPAMRSGDMKRLLLKDKEVRKLSWETTGVGRHLVDTVIERNMGHGPENDVKCLNQA